MMQSNLANGETISVGAACMITFFAGALASMVGQLDDAGRTSNETSLAMVTDAIGLLPADEIGPLPPAQGMGAAGEHTGDTELVPDDAVEAARRLLADPSTYEDGNTEYGLEQALELARLLVAEADGAT